MEYREVAYGTTGEPKHDSVHFYDAPGGTKIGALGKPSYGILLEVKANTGPAGAEELWYGIDANDTLVRFARAAGFENVEVTKIDYNKVVDAMVKDVYGKVVSMMEVDGGDAA